MQNPLNTYVAWFTGLPEHHRSDIASFFTYMWPNHPLEPKVVDADLPERFVAWVNSVSDNPFKAVGLSLALIAITEFVFIDQRGSHEDWAVTKNRLLDMKEKMQTHGFRAVDTSGQRVTGRAP